MLKNGKTIKCRLCKKGFYISHSRFGKKWYCSKECAKKDNFGFKPKKKKCVICNKSFLITMGIRMWKKTCSYECHVELAKQTTKKSEERRRSKIIIRICKNCQNKFAGHGQYITKFCSTNCQYDHYSKTRKDKNNPNFRNGKYTHANFQNRKSKTAYKHLNECRRYRKEFLKKHEYLFCEVCRVNKNGTPRFEVHHIYFASRYPKHKNLHNNRNMILLCKQCHLNFHDGKKYNAIFEKLEKSRNLKELFYE